MKLYFDLDTLQLVNAPGEGGTLKSVAWVRGDGITLNLTFLSGGSVVALAAEPDEMIFVVKTGRAVTDAPVLLADSWTEDEASHAWQSTLLADTEALMTLLGENESKDLLGEFTFTPAGGSPSTSQTIKVRVTNDLWKGTEGTPLSLPTPEAWLAAQPPKVLIISGELAYMGASVKFAPIIQAEAMVGGKLAYTHDGAAPDASGHECYWGTDEVEAGAWSLNFGSIVTARWQSTADVATPDLVPAGPWDAELNPHAWQQIGLTTGDPVFSSGDVISAEGVEAAGREVFAPIAHTQSASTLEDITPSGLLVVTGREAQVRSAIEATSSISTKDLIGEFGPYNSEAEARAAGVVSGEKYRLLDGSLKVMRASVATGALHYLPLQSDLTDLGSAGVTVTATGTSKYAAGRYGNCFDFDGSTMLEFTSALATNNPWALFVTIRPRGTASDQIVISRTDAGSNRDFYLLYSGGSDRLTFGYYTPAGALVTTSSADAPATRIRKASSCRVGFGFDGTNVWCSMDGEIWMQVVATMHSAPSVAIRLGGPLDIGSSNFYSAFTGQMQELRIYQSGITTEPAAVRNYGHGLVAGISVPVKGPGVSDVANVYIQSGQSNGQVGYEIYTGQETTWPPIGWDDRVNWAGRNGTTTISGSWKALKDRASLTGPDYWYLRRLADCGVPSLYGITSCVSGMSIVQWGNGGAQWTALTGLVDTQLALLSGYRIRAFVWNQGEQDATTEVLANAYQARLTSFVAQVRARWGSDLPFIAVIPDLTAPYGAYYIETIRAAIAAVDAADPLFHTIDSRSYTRIDGVHLAQVDVQKIGYLIARKLAEL